MTDYPHPILGWAAPPTRAEAEVTVSYPGSRAPSDLTELWVGTIIAVCLILGAALITAWLKRLLRRRYNRHLARRLNRHLAFLGNRNLRLSTTSSLLKGNPMPPSVRVDHGDVTALPPESSVNDFHREREQDQAIAQLTEQLAAMAGPLWKVGVDASVTDRLASEPAFKAVASMLALISEPVSSVGSYRANSAPGTYHYVNVGHLKVACRNPAAGAELSRCLIRATWDVLAPVRASYLKWLHDFSRQGGPSDARFPSRVAVSSGIQRVAFVDTPEAAASLCDALNGVYERHVADARLDLLVELEAFTRPEVSRDLGKPVNSEAPAR